MIVNRYSGMKKLFKRESVFRKVVYVAYKPKIRKDILRCIHEKSLFTQVEIETINRCNGVCPFCPINRNNDTREFARMSEELFNKIVTELGELDYRGNLALFSNNEPFIDVRIIDFAQIARKAVPNAFIHLYTNGTLLTEQKIIDILPYLDRMIIDNYDDDLHLTEQSRIADRLCKQNPEIDKKLEIHLRKLNEILYTRGGQAPNNAKKKPFNMPCNLPAHQLIIRPTGHVSLCCNDALGKYTLGDVNKNSLLEIWNSEKYIKIREELAKDRTGLEICKYCDTFSL